MTELGYYPGCSNEGTGREYGESLLAVTDALSIRLNEINDWSCCGASAAHNINHELSVQLPARNFVLAQKQNMKDILVPCAACYSRFISTADVINKSNESKVKSGLNLSLPIPYTIGILEFLEKYIQPVLKEKNPKQIQLNAACYYGCLLVRPVSLTKTERSEDPQVMEKTLSTIGIESVRWAYKTECCGAGLSVSGTPVVAKLCANIVQDAEARNADVIVVACPMCHSNLDLRRSEIEKVMQKKSEIPVLYITQLIGLSLGIDPAKLGLLRHKVSVKNLLQKLSSQNTAVKTQ